MSKHSKIQKNLYYLVQLLIRFFSNLHMYLWFLQRPLFEYFKFTIWFWLATWCISSLCTNPQKGLCLNPSKKILKLQILKIFNLFQPSSSKVSTTLKKIKTNIWHYSWKLLSFWTFSGHRKYIWKCHFL